MHTILAGLGYKQKGLTNLCTNNQSAIAFTKDTGYNARTKHINIQQHFIQDQITNKTLQINYIQSANNPANIFTKPLARPQHLVLTMTLGLFRAQGGVLDIRIALYDLGASCRIPQYSDGAPHKY
jgi:hypothetical protein